MSAQNKLGASSGAQSIELNQVLYVHTHLLALGQEMGCGLFRVLNI